MFLNRLLTVCTRFYNHLLQNNSNLLFRDILNTCPISVNPNSDVTLYCALENTSCRAFILAAKSFLRFYNDIALVVQNDGTLTDHNISEIRAHIPGVLIYSYFDMQRMLTTRATQALLDVLPSFSCYLTCIPIRILYLKLLNVVLRFPGRKVIIMDSDLLFLRKPNEVIEWIQAPYTRDFYGEGSNASASKFYQMGFSFKSLDIANFSSGFIGLLVPTQQEPLVQIFQRIMTYDSTLFTAWEIEQAIWSVILADRHSPLNLDSLRDVYIGSGWRRFAELKDKAVLVHFAGAFRFRHFRYLRLANHVIHELNQDIYTSIT